MDTLWRIRLVVPGAQRGGRRGVREWAAGSLARYLRILVAILLVGGSTALLGWQPIQATGPNWSEYGGPSLTLAADDDEDDEDDDDGDEPSPLSRKRVPPNADEELFGFFDANQGGDSRCSLELGGAASEGLTFRVVSDDNQEVGTLLYLCFGGFTPFEGVDVEMKPSGGSAQHNRVRADADGIAQWRVPLVPTNPLAEYSVSASQGHRGITDTFKPNPAAKARLLIDPRSVQAGATLRIYLAGLDTLGFKSGDRVRLRLHRREGPPGQEQARYLTDLPSVTIDAHGQGMTQLRTARSDKKERYTVYAVNPKLDPKDPAREIAQWVFEVK